MSSDIMPPVAEQMEILLRGTAEVIPAEEFLRLLTDAREAKRPLRVKLGCDPSRPDLHLGHAVVLRKLRQFQDCGHTAILIVGDFTAMIGDPSGRNKARPALSIEETRANGETYFAQASRILRADRLEILNNSDWLGKMHFEDVIRLASKYTVARMLERDDFEKRHRANEPISVHEFLYPLAQAMDSVAVKADVELGGTDQKFNLLVGREIQKEYGQRPQAIMMLPILEGTDGVEKMSKSLDNYVAITDAPDNMYGKVLSIPDTLILRYFLLATDVPAARMREIERDLALPGYNPRNAKRELARAIVTLYHGAPAAQEAEEAFDRIFIQKQAPEDISTHTLPAGARVGLLELMTQTGLAPSKSEARRLVDQGGVSIDGERCADSTMPVPDRDGIVLKVGKRKFLKILRK